MNLLCVTNIWHFDLESSVLVRSFALLYLDLREKLQSIGPINFMLFDLCSSCS